MTVARIIAISLMVCAVIGLTTQAEAAKRKSTITFRGCADLDLLCGPVMKDVAGNRHAFIPSGLVPPGVPLKVVGRRSGDVPGGWCKARRRPQVGPAGLARARRVTDSEIRNSSGASGRAQARALRHIARLDPFGPNPTGRYMLDAAGRFSYMIYGSGRPNFVSNNRREGTQEENKAAVQGIITFYGTYIVDESAHTVTWQVERCSFPNWEGSERKTSVTVNGDDLSYTADPIPSAAGPYIPHVTWKRAK